MIMHVVLNGDPCELPRGSVVSDLVAQRLSDPRGVAIAVNGEVVPRSMWPTTALALHDRIEILSPAQGG
jgi:sulfur carrier protein